jgi:Ca-activated chloride channel family protein
MTTPVPVFSDAQFHALAGESRPPEAGFGSLSTERGALPLAALDVRARLDGLVAATEVTQTFVNTHAGPLEATYVFPLPDRAAVTAFRLETAGRVVEGELRERGKARQEYDEAVQAGRRAAIAEEERPGVFTMRVGNLPAGERAVVRLTLVGPLPCVDGEVTFRFPLVVAPRYIPGTPLGGEQAGAGVAGDTDAVPDASRISPPVLLPGFPNPVRLSLAVEVAESALAPHDFCSSLHAVVADEGGSGRRFRVLPGERLDRDFVFRYRVGAEGVGTSLAVCPDAGGEEGTFLLTVLPPGGVVARRPRAVVFVLDRSGSMGGWKMVAARRAVTRMVETLTEDDRFSVYAFDDRLATPPDFDGTALVPGSDRHRFRAAEFLAGIDARGGTEMAAPLEKAVQELTRSGPAAGGERVLVLITDGQVGNEDAVLRQLAGRAAGVRIFTLGIDRAVNAAFLRRLADLGGGASEVVESEERLDAVMDQVHRSIGTPVLTGLSLSPAGLGVVASSLTPGRLPDLFAGAPLLIAGRYRGAASGAVRLHAQDAAGAGWSAEVSARREDAAPLAKVWARARVRELEDRYATDRDDKAKLEHEILQTSLGFGVLSRFTAFVAVDRSAVVNPGGVVTQVVQPVEPPAGWGAQAAGALAACAPPNAGGVTRTGAMRSRIDRCVGESVRHKALGAPAAAFDDEFEDDDAVGGRSFRGVPASKTGILQQLLGLFGRGNRQGGPAAPPDREPFRGRVESLLARLEAQPADTAAGVGLLRALAAELQALFTDLVAAGDLHGSVEQLGKTLATLPALLQEPAPQPTAVEDHQRRLAAALREWLTLLPPHGNQGGPTGRREGFWK